MLNLSRIKNTLIKCILISDWKDIIKETHKYLQFTVRK